MHDALSKPSASICEQVLLESQNVGDFDLSRLSGEYFRQDVLVVPTADKVLISYALWEIALPNNWVQENQVIEQLLNQKITRSEALKHLVAKPLVALLDAQGCFTLISKASYKLCEVKALFGPLKSAWYAEYYAHPVWQKLSSGQASRNCLFAWLIHNYHISRAAGIVAARMAVFGRNAIWTDFFYQDTLDEYWHCDAYYSLDTPLLKSLSLSQIKEYLPLPASLAFEEHTLQVAENDSLGHLLIAYFQESSIIFEGNSRDFYQLIEQKYQLQGLFTPWKQHIQIDVDQGHSDGLGHLLESDQEIDATSLEQSLRTAWLAFYLLKCGLDEILSLDTGDQLNLRMPSRQKHNDSKLQHVLERHLKTAIQVESLTDSECAHLQHGLRDSAFRALSFSRGHDEIIACGHWAKKLSYKLPQLKELSTPSPWCIVLINHMHEAANNPIRWLLLVSLLANRVPTFKLGGERSVALCQVLSSSDTFFVGASSALIQLDELITKCANCQDRMPVRLL